MENKYYIPEIEDLHVGYEYMMMNGDKWEETVLIESDFFGSLTQGYENMFEEIVTKLRSIKVPYLTREQIEKEGWLLAQDSILTDDFEIGIFGINTLKTKTIDYTPKNHKLVIKTYLYNPEAPEYLFYGICKSINEFRTIIKLLNI